MTKIISLKKKRKEKIRAEKEEKAAENRYKFGRTKGEKKLEELNSERAKKHIDGHRIGLEEENTDKK